MGKSRNRVFRKEPDAFGEAMWLFGDPLPEAPGGAEFVDVADWRQANPQEIEKALKKARALPSGGWHVLDETRGLTSEPKFYYIDSHEITAWKDGDVIRAVLNRCPHMGAPLSEGTVRHGTLTCPWHGLPIGEGEGKHGRLFETHDDGVLTWIKPGQPKDGTPEPILPPRPSRYIDGVIRFVARCDPEDVIANRLDPWHGVHFHPHSFARLKVLDKADAAITVRVAFRAFGKIAVEVDCTFHCPEPNTIVMTIVAGDGKDSVVETHATPLCPGWTMITEATLAWSDRPGFSRALNMKDRIRPSVKKRAMRLWVDDRAYVERRYYLRHPELLPEMVSKDIENPVGKPRFD